MRREAIEVRRARRDDGAAFLGLVDALARYERLDPPDDAARARLLQDAFGADGARPRFTVLLVETRRDHESEARAVGYAIILETYSSFLARPTLYLEDLFVDPDARGLGAGRRLIEAVAEEALGRGCHRIEGVVLEWNEPAHGFYARTGAKVMRDWFLLRYDRDAIETLASVGKGPDEAAPVKPALERT